MSTVTMDTEPITDDDRRVVEGILARIHAPGGYEAFESQVRAIRGCRRPVRLSGRSIRMDHDGLNRRDGSETIEQKSMILNGSGIRSVPA